MEAPLTIRPAGPADLDAVVALYLGDPLHASREPRDVDRTEAFAEIMGDPRELLLVAERDGRVVGTLQLTFLRYLTYGGARVGLVEAVQVADGQRGRGVGSALMRYAIDEAKRCGCNRVQLTSNKARKDAHRFYERLGFVATHEGFKLFL
jgi:GNAT superfamily N-acetyltransferase